MTFRGEFLKTEITDEKESSVYLGSQQCTQPDGSSVAKREGGDYFEAHSAGLEPGELNPLAVQVMDQIGIDISNNKTQAVFDVFKTRQFFPYVITVCDVFETAGCPIFPGVTQRLHWSCPDPSRLSGTQWERLESTRQIRDEIRARTEASCDEMCVVGVKL